MTGRRDHGRAQPIQLIRYGLPAGILVAGIVIAIIGSSAITRTLGVVLIGVAFLVLIVNALARLTISSQDDRDREQRARERYARRGRWTP